MARRPDPEKLDKAAKLKIAGSAAALLVAVVFLSSYYFGFSLFGSGRAKEVELSPQQVEEVKKIREENKRKAEEPVGPSGKKPVIVGS